MCYKSRVGHHSRGNSVQMKRRLIFILLLVLPLSSCMSWFMEQPTIVLKEVSITRISLTDIHFSFGIEVQNPNSFNLNLKNLDYTVFFNDREVAKGRLEQEIVLAKSSSTMVKIPLQTDFKSLGDPVAIILSGKDLGYRIEGSALLGALVGSASVPFSKTGEIKIKK